MSEIALPLEQISVRRPSIAKTIMKRATPFLFLAPALLLVLFWVYRPLVETFGLSTKQWNMNPNVEPINVGLENFRYIFTHPDFLQAVLNTAIYILAMLPFSVVIPMILAIVTNNLSNRVKNIYRALFFLPMIMPPVAISAVWRWLMCIR